MTLEELQTRLGAYLAAEIAILQSQEYTVGNGSNARRNRRADLVEVRKGIADTRAEIALLQPAGARPRRIMYLRPF